MTMETLLNHIWGSWIPATSGELLDQRDPADLRSITCRFQRSSRTDAVSAIEAAAAAFPSWSALPCARRGDILLRAVELMRERRELIAGTIVAENGKTMREAQGEVEAAIREMAWQVAEGLRLPGEMTPSAHPGVLAYAVRRPLGVVSVICPWNFPFNVPARKCTPALMAGNTVVFKPASLTPSSGAWFVRILQEAGLPPGVLNLITGDGGTVGDELVRHPLIRAVSFTGSTPVGLGIQRAAAGGLVKTQLEMGGKNAIIVLDDAQLDLAAEATVLGAFACAGQWCTSTSRAIVQRGVLEAFTQRVLALASRLTLGRGSDPRTGMGPVCGRAQLEGITAAMLSARQEGARLRLGGRQLLDGEMSQGCFIEPTVFSDVTPGMRVASEEIFGPVLAVLAVDDFEQAVTVSNQVPFGLCSSIYTASLSQAMRFIERSEVGMAHVNLPTSMKEPQMPFGGIKHSGFGTPEAGRSGIEFFTRHQVAYIRHSPESPPGTR